MVNANRIFLFLLLAFCSVESILAVRNCSELEYCPSQIGYAIAVWFCLSGIFLWLVVSLAEWAVTGKFFPLSRKGKNDQTT